MAIICQRCGAQFDATLFEFDHVVQCNCGAKVRYPGLKARSGHVTAEARRSGKPVPRLAQRPGTKFLRFEPTIFEFLEQLTDNNNRPWFQANKERYEREVLEPSLAFIRAFAPHLKRISRFFVASDRRVGGSLLRVYQIP